MAEQLEVSPSTGSLAIIACAGVSCRSPPKGITTEAAPMVESNLSARPLREQQRRLPISFASRSRSVSCAPKSAVKPGTCAASLAASCGRAGTLTRACFSAPLLARKLRAISTMVLPRQLMRRRGSALTWATTVASMFSAAAPARKRSASSAATTTAMRSWLSEMASSVPSRPSYFLGTRSRSISSPSASSPMATETPPAPKSLQRFIMRVMSPLRNRRWSLRSTGALPFCTSAPQSVRLCVSWALLEPVAPPMPSRPVRPPSSITASPGAGRERTTFFSGAAATTAPISMRLATYPG